MNSEYRPMSKAEKLEVENETLRKILAEVREHMRNHKCIACIHAWRTLEYLDAVDGIVDRALHKAMIDRDPEIRRRRGTQ